MGLGDYRARETIDLQGRTVCPGFIDGHVHIESSMATPPEFARAVVPRGTTSVVADPHEIANVLGIEGARYMLDASEGLPLTVFVMAPSCVPATHLETSGAELLWVMRQEMAHLLAVAQEMGSQLHDPFMTLSFLALPVIPALKLTDKALVDVTRFEFVPLFEEQRTGGI